MDSIPVENIDSNIQYALQSQNDIIFDLMKQYETKLQNNLHQLVDNLQENKQIEINNIKEQYEKEIEKLIEKNNVLSIQLNQQDIQYQQKIQELEYLVEKTMKQYDHLHQVIIPSKISIQQWKHATDMNKLMKEKDDLNEQYIQISEISQIMNTKHQTEIAHLKKIARDRINEMSQEVSVID